MLLPYLRLVLGFEKRALSDSISFHVLCLPLLILSSILHIVDIVIDVFAAVAAAACYSNFKCRECGRGRELVKDAHRFSSTKRNIYIFLRFSCSRTPLSYTYSLRHQRYFNTHNNNKNKNAERRKKNSMCWKKPTHIASDCNENQPHWTGNNNNNF